MTVLSFSLTPEATARVYELLVCLAKFGESVAIEAKSDKVAFLLGRRIMRGSALTMYSLR